jgi:MYXO-CTERM domain-containing protein
MDPTKPVPWRYAGALAVAALAMAARRRKNRG